MEKALVAERTLNKQLELKVGAEENKIRVIEKQAVRKIKTLKTEVLSLKARLRVAPLVPAVPAAPVAPPAPVSVAAPVVPVVASAAPAAPVTPLAAAAAPAKSMAA